MNISQPQDKKIQMRKHVIAFIVDNPTRDLMPLCLLAGELSKHFEVCLIPVAQALFEVFRISPELVVLNYLRVSNLNLVRKLIRAGIPFSILDTEGGVFMKLPNSNETTYSKTTIADASIRNNVSQYFVWGEVLFNDLVKGDIYPNDAVLCLGTPRTDFLHQSFKGYFRSAESSAHVNRVLVNTSFPINNPKFSTPSAESKMLVDKFNYSANFVNNLVGQLGDVMIAYIEMIEFLSAKLPNIEFVVRPHPFEDDQIYKTRLAHLPNVKVCCEGNVANWLWNSRALIHFECSTAIEAGFVGIPALSLSKYKNVRPIDAVQQVTDYVDSKEQMLSKLNEIFAGKYQKNPSIDLKLRTLEREVYFQVDGHSYFRIAGAIRSWLLDNEARKKWAVIQFYRAYFFFRTIAKFMVKGQLSPPDKIFKESDVNSILKSFVKKLGHCPTADRYHFSTSVRIRSRAGKVESSSGIVNAGNIEVI